MDETDMYLSMALLIRDSHGIDVCFWKTMLRNDSLGINVSAAKRHKEVFNNGKRSADCSAVTPCNHVFAKTIITALYSKERLGSGRGISINLALPTTRFICSAAKNTTRPFSHLHFLSLYTHYYFWLYMSFLQSEQNSNNYF
jgi:hypothetical protein